MSNMIVDDSTKKTADPQPANKAGKNNAASTGPVVIPKTAMDLQKMRLEKLMQNPQLSFKTIQDKPVVIPDPPKSKKTPEPPDFVRNVMGSSAGAGSGEFHVYRHLRRKEYARQKFINEKALQEQLDEEYHRKIEANKRAAEERTAKKRAKRLKKKQMKKKQKTQDKKKSGDKDEKSDEEDDDDESDDDDDSHNGRDEAAKEQSSDS